MSSLNKAFLKAYQKSGAKTAPASAPASAPTANQPVVTAQSPPAPHFATQPAAAETVAAAKSHVTILNRTSNPTASLSSSLVVDTSATGSATPVLPTSS